MQKVGQRGGCLALAHLYSGKSKHQMERILIFCFHFYFQSKDGVSNDLLPRGKITTTAMSLNPTPEPISGRGTWI
jgi:hypothetical protein